ncbi:MAG: hypothetical protein QGF74_02950 [Candidatus Nanoarchaeia archaeon]|jgi:flagellar basal body-associated protein FliL|nr:hypothetical protein [Candidatus Nanoarchaeia archaeon]|tara:strand:+ start:3164 stop:3352 length:189 start_codon:yes stop_codon:yes gene_type:complete
MQKRGQTTIFVILGIIIVIIIGVYALVAYGIVNKSFTYAQSISNAQDDIDEFVRECIRFNIQ